MTWWVLAFLCRTQSSLDYSVELALLPHATGYKNLSATKTCPYEFFPKMTSIYDRDTTRHNDQRSSSTIARTKAAFTSAAVVLNFTPIYIGGGLGQQTPIVM